MQAELRRAAVSTKIIRELMQSALNQAPNAARIRLSEIHNGVVGLSGVGMLRFDVTMAVVNPGYAPGEFVVNLPLSQWSGYLDTLIRGDCASSTAAGSTDPAAAARLAAMHIGFFIACPVTDVESRMFGGVFISWDEQPPERVVADVRLKLAAVAKQIASTLDVRDAP